MNSNPKTKKRMGVAAAILVAAGVVGGIAMRRAAVRSHQDLGPLYEVKRGPLDITVTTSGTIQSRKNVMVLSEVEGRNTILWIIDEGTTVTNGQLLLEMDSSSFTDKLTEQQISVANASDALVQAEEKLAVARNAQEAYVAEAHLKLELAVLEIEKYAQGEYPQSLQEATGRIMIAKEEVERAAEDVNWSRKLADQGYLTRSELQADELTLKQKQNSYDQAVTALNVLTNYTHRRQTATLESDRKQAEMALERIVRERRADVIQAESNLRARQQESERQNTRLEKLETSVRNCKVYAPTNGLVIYASTVQASRRHWGSDPLQAGSQVNERQELIQIPLDGGMIVEMSVPESALNKLALDQRARVKIEALPGSVFTGHLSKIGLLPDGRNTWLNPDLKLYNCEIELDSAEGLRSGMNCEAELHVDHYDDAIAVPLQCVIRVGDEPVVFVAQDGEAVARPVVLGLDNNRHVRVLEGLDEGDLVLLDPPLAKGGKGHPGGDPEDASGDKPRNGDGKRSAEGNPGRPRQPPPGGNPPPGP